MATEYDLNISTDLKPAYIVQIIAGELDLERNGDDYIITPSLFITATEKEHTSADYYSRLFGFRPNMLMGFRLQPKLPEGERIGRQEMLRAVMALLRHEAGDAVLLLNGERLILQRLDGRLVLNKEWHEWETYSLLNEITLPHDLQKLKSPLLA